MLRNLVKVLACFAVAATACVVWISLDAGRDALDVARTHRPDRRVTVTPVAPDPRAPERDTPIGNGPPAAAPGDDELPDRDARLAEEALRVVLVPDVSSISLHEATGQLVALVRADSGLATRIADMVLAGDCTPIVEVRLLECLGAAGSEACQRGLLLVLQAARSSGHQRLQAVRSLASVTRPIPAVDAALADSVDGRGPLAGSAALTLAVLGRRVKDAAPARYESAERVVVAFLHSATGPEQLRQALDATRQLGLTTIPDRVIEAVRGSNPDLRAAALRAIGSIATPEAEPYLLWSMREDPVEGVRCSALEAYATRLPRGEHAAAQEEFGSPCAVLRRLADVDPSARVRQLAIGILESAGS